MSAPPRMMSLFAVSGLAVALAVALAPQPAMANGCLFPPAWDPATNTYTISTAAQLHTLSQGACDMSATIRLANDIDLTGTGEFRPIGSGNNQGPFTGTFDGAGHSITGLQITAPPENGFGLFGHTSGATIRNVRVSGTVSGAPSGAGSDSGALVVGQAAGTAISNVHASGTVNVVGAAAGIAASMTGRSTLRDSTASVTVTSASIAGGAMGFGASYGIPGAAITNVRTEGSVSSSGASAGGIAATLGGVDVVRSSSSASVTGMWAGGIAAQAQSDGLAGIVISDSYSTSAVSATPGSAQQIAGILGSTCSAQPVGLVRNYFAGTLTRTGTATSAGILGADDTCVVSIGTQATSEGNLWNSDTTGPAGAGGAVGVGRTTAQMKEIGTYTALGWSIVNGWEAPGSAMWGICPQVNGGYPFLQGQTPSTACTAPAATPAAAAALTATLLPSRRRVASGQRVRIGIRTTNPGSTAAQAVTSCVRLPSNLVITSAAGAVRSGRTACFRVDTMAAGTTVTKVVTVRAVSLRRTSVTVTGTARATGVSRVNARPVTVTIRPRAVRARVTG